MCITEAAQKTASIGICICICNRILRHAKVPRIYASTSMLVCPSLRRRLYFFVNKVYFLKCIFPKCVFPKYIFPKCIFPKCIFSKCIPQKCIFPKCIFQTIIFPKCSYPKCIFAKYTFLVCTVYTVHMYSHFFQSKNCKGCPNLLFN